MKTWILVSQWVQLAYCVVGLCGNALSLAVFFRRKMRSPYVWLLRGLAFFDLLVLLKGLLAGLTVVGVLDISFASTPMFFFRWMCDLGSKYFVVAIAFDRYLAVCHPLLGLRWERRGVWLAGSVVAFAMGMSVVSYMLTYVSYSQLIYKSILLSFIPVVVVVLFSGGMAYGIWEYNKSKVTLGVQRKDVSATKMLLAVTSFFGLCCGVEATRRILEFCGYYEGNPGWGFYDYNISHLSDHAYLLNSAANTAIYGLTCRRFRQEVGVMFGCEGRSRVNATGRTEVSKSTETVLSDVTRE